MSLLRTRWVAVGAAVAITLGAGGFVSATVNSGSRTVFVPITPCRIMDTRPSFVVGPRSASLGAEETYTVDAHGTNGQCTLPNDASGLVPNVTATDATLDTFIAAWGDGARPNASSLNPSPGQPPTPNAVTTDLTSAGEFKLFNKAGNVNVFVDVVGYYANHNHDDRYYLKDEIDQRVPKINTITVGSAAFSAVDTSYDVEKSTDGLYGTGGAHIFDGFGGAQRLVAPSILPDGVTITSIDVHYLDYSGARYMEFTLRCEKLDPPGSITSKANRSTSGFSADWRTISLSGLPVVIDTSECAYFLQAFGDWDGLGDSPHLMKVGPFVITYETPG